MTIPVSEPLLDGNEIKYLLECIASGWVSSEGPFVKRFEQQMAMRVGRKFGIAVANGSAALDVAIAALGISHGDEVIVPTFTIISCASAIVRAGAIPVLVDSDPQTWNMDADQIESRITPNTKAIMIVHIYGLPVDLNPILELAEKYNLSVIEDAAEMLGQTYRGLPCGSFGDVSTFSFYSNKLVTTGEGGMLVTNDDHLAQRCRSLRNLCFGHQQRFVHDDLGWNLRMSNLQAAVGVAQLERLDTAIRRKRQIGLLYSELLKELDCLQLPLTNTDFAENIYWVYGIVLHENAGLSTAKTMEKLGGMGIGTRPFFWCMHEQPALRKMGLFDRASFPVGERLARTGFYLPSGLTLTDNEVQFVADGLLGLFK
jgi:perosamine synthetase